MINLQDVKRDSERYVTSLGGTVCDWLPFIDLEEISIRDSRSVACRALALSMLVMVSFGAPISIARKWLKDNDVFDSLTESEKMVIDSKYEPSDQIRNQYRWRIESLWAAAWVGQLSPDLWPVQELSDSLASWFPNLKTSEPANNFLEKYTVRSSEEIYTKLDLFYRAHWHARNCQLSGENPGKFNLGVVQQRRQFLEWVLHNDVEWDDVDLST